MSKKKTKKKVSVNTVNKTYLTANQFNALRTSIQNTTYTLTREMLNRLLSPTDDIEDACGYPATLSINDYRNMYNRYGLAKRVVHIWPDECWQRAPLIYENEDKEETAFEKAWKELDTRLGLTSCLHRADILSGIGAFGGILLGLDDAAAINRPVQGIDPNTGEVTERKTRNLLYVQAYDEGMLRIDSYNTNTTSPRYNYPIEYAVVISSGGMKSTSKVQQKVHWTRIVHLADNRESSEVIGASRLQAAYNYLYDVKKVGGGSGEMFWKGGFPGYSFELSPEAAEMGAEMDTESIKEQMQLYATGLQRWLALQGVTAKSLNPQLSDPGGHLDVQLKLIAISIGVPYRVLLGSEEGKLASVQDKRTWNGRVARRQNNYCSPMVVRPFIDRLIDLGCLPEPKQYIVEWPDLNVSTEDDEVKVALNRTEAFSKYVAGGVDTLIPPRQYFTIVHKLTDEEANSIIKEQEKYDSIFEEEEEEKLVGEPKVTPPATKPAKTTPS